MTATTGLDSIPVIQKTARATGSVAPANTLVSDTMDIARAMQSKADAARLDAEIARATADAAAKVAATNGSATGMSLTAPAISGGTLTGPAVSGGTFSGGDTSAQMVMPSGANRMRSEAAMAGDFPTPASFLAVGQTEAQLRSGGIDAGPAISAAWAKGAVRLPAGNYRLDTPLVAPASNTALVGEAEGCVRIFVNCPAGDAITVPAGLGNVRIERIQFLPSVTRLTAAVIAVYGSNTTLRDIRIDASGGNTFFDGVSVRGGAVATRLSGFYFSGCRGSGVELAKYPVDTYISDGNTAGCGAGVHIRSASGVYMHHLDLVGSLNSGVVIDPDASAGDAVNAVYATAVLSDTSQYNGWAIIGDGKVSEINLNHTWASASGTTNVFQSSQAITIASAGYLISNPNLNGLCMVGGRAKGNGGGGIIIGAGQNISIGSGTQVLMNGEAYGQPGITNRSDGISILGAATNVMITGVVSGAGGWEQITAGRTNKQAYGLFRNTGTGGQSITVMGSQFPGNVVGGYAIGTGTGDHIVDLGNQQF